MSTETATEPTAADDKKIIDEYTSLHASLARNGRQAQVIEAEHPELFDAYQAAIRREETRRQYSSQTLDDEPVALPKSSEKPQAAMHHFSHHTFTVRFARAFETVPVVVATCANGIANIVSVSETEFTVKMRDATSGSISWVAMPPTQE